MTFTIPPYSRQSALSSLVRKFVCELKQAAPMNQVKDQVIPVATVESLGMRRRQFLRIFPGAALLGTVLKGCEKEKKPIIPDLSKEEAENLWEEVMGPKDGEYTGNVAGGDGSYSRKITDMVVIEKHHRNRSEDNPESN
jgi:hypothetical protein